VLGTALAISDSASAHVAQPLLGVGSPGRFVAVTEDDLATAALERSPSIDILAFVPFADIDAHYWDTPYLAPPARSADHSYALLARGLAASGRVGVAKYVVRQRQQLAGLLSIDGRLVLCTMRFHEDLVAVPAAPALATLAGRELNLAAKLIEGMAEPWQPEKYTDDYVQALRKVIDAKAEGAPLHKAKGQPAPAANVQDLVAGLRESLAAAGTRPKVAGRPNGSRKRWQAEPGRRRPARVRVRKSRDGLSGLLRGSLRTALRRPAAHTFP